MSETRTKAFPSRSGRRAVSFKRQQGSIFSPLLWKYLSSRLGYHLCLLIDHTNDYTTPALEIIALSHRPHCMHTWAAHPYTRSCATQRLLAINRYRGPLFPSHCPTQIMLFTARGAGTPLPLRPPILRPPPRGLHLLRAEAQPRPPGVRETLSPPGRPRAVSG
jgi:hypothetical protein